MKFYGSVQNVRSPIGTFYLTFLGCFDCLRRIFHLGSSLTFMTLNNELNLNSDICFTILGEPKGVVYIINYCGFKVKYLEYNQASIFDTVLCKFVPGKCLTFFNTLYHIHNHDSNHNSQISLFHIVTLQYMLKPIISVVKVFSLEAVQFGWLKIKGIYAPLLLLSLSG